MTGAVGVTGVVRGYWLESTVDGFSEAGAGPFNLTIDEQELDSLLGEAGFDVTWTRSVSWGVLQPGLRASYLREFEDGARLIRGRFSADPSSGDFLVPTDAPDTGFFNLGLSIKALIGGGTTFFVVWDSDLEREDLELETSTGGFRLAW